MLKNQYSVHLESATSNFLLRNYGDSALAWINSLDDIVKELSCQWNIQIVGQEPNSRFGCILYAKGIEGDVVLKLVPPCCSRFQQEILCYQVLPYHNMVHLYSYDMIMGGFMMEKIENYPIQNLGVIAGLFHTMFEERTIARHENLQKYTDAFLFSINYAESIIKDKNNICYNRLLPLINRAKLLYSVFSKNQEYVIHGDTHIHNILFNESDIYLIDPIGYIGPFEIEYARFIGTYIRENGILSSELLPLVEQISNNDWPIINILFALEFDVTMRTCNTFFEGNIDEEIVDAINWCENIWQLVDCSLRSLE